MVTVENALAMTRLKEENARLRQWHNTALVLNDRIKRYQLLLHAAPDPALSSVVARVIGRCVGGELGATSGEVIYLSKTA